MDAVDFKAAAEAVAAAVLAHTEELTALDQAIGDGDHGVNMRRGMEAVLAHLPDQAGKPPGEAIRALGLQIVMTVGGASGPLYGTLAMEFGKALPPDPTRADVAAAFTKAIAALKARGKSDVGEKTMLDVLAPVSEALAAGAASAALAKIAAEALAATKPMRATKGRASFLGDRSIGHLDPGARSSQIIVDALAKAFP